MDGSYLLQMNLRFGHGKTSAGAGHGLGEGQVKVAGAMSTAIGRAMRLHF